MQNQSQLDYKSISVLIEPSKRGEESSREKLFAELQDYLELTARQNIGAQTLQKAGASDIVQASFLRIVEKFDQFKGRSTGELKAWIKVIVKNEANSLRRSFQAEKRDVRREVSLSPVDSTSPGLAAVDANLTPASDAVKAEQNKRLHEVLESLDPDAAEVIRLRNFQSLSFKQIGEKMGRSEQAASQLWYRAILKFEKRLRESGFEENKN